MTLFEEAGQRAGLLPPWYANDEEYEYAMDMAYASSDADYRLFLRGWPVADIVETRSDLVTDLMDAVSPRPAVVCKVDGCTNEAPARGRYAKLCPEHRPNGAATPPPEVAELTDTEVVNALAKYLRDNDSWNGADFCELAAGVITRSGRSLVHDFHAFVVVTRGNSENARDAVAVIANLDEAVFVGDPWPVAAADDVADEEFDTLGVLDQHPEK